MSVDGNGPGSAPTITVVVPATDEPPTLARCEAALREALGPGDELIVVDEPTRSGPAAARNRAAEQATGELLLFVDADVLVDPGAVERVRARFAADAGLTALFGSYDDSPEAPGMVAAFRNLLHHHVHHSHPGPAVTFWAGLGAVRRDAFIAAGGFDAERYRVPSIEDIELGMRLSERGERIELDPRIQGKHLKAWTLRGMVRTDFAQRGVPWIELLASRYGAAGGAHAEASALNLGWRHRLSALAALGIVAGVASRRAVPVLASAAAIVALNRDFYALLARRRGPGGAAVGVGLHTVHHLSGIASVPVGIIAARNGRLRRAR